MYQQGQGGATRAEQSGAIAHSHDPKHEQLIDLDSPDTGQAGQSQTTSVVIETSPYDSGASACGAGPSPSPSSNINTNSAIPTKQDRTKSAKQSDFDSPQTEVKRPLVSGLEDPCRSSDHLLDKPFPRPGSWMSIHNSAYYMRYALGCYGWPVYLYMHPCVGCCKLWIDCRCVFFCLDFI